MGDDVLTLVGPVFEIVRSGSGVPAPPLTWVEAVPVVVKFCADRVPVTDAVVLMVVPLAAVTMPVMVTTQVPPPSIVPPLQVTNPLLCAQLPRVLVSASFGGTPMPPTPFTWSDSSMLVSLDPAVFTMVIT